MKPLKAGRPTIEFIKACYQAGLPPMLCGSHGVGKSQLIKQAAIELGIDSIERDLSLMEPPDLVGLPKVSGKTTTYLPPDFLPSAGKGILLIEEINRAPSYMTAPCLQLLTNRTLNDYSLPSGWIAAAAINPDGEDYDVRPLDAALLSRFVRTTVVPDAKEWLTWAERTGVHRAVRDYIALDPTALAGVEANPRAWAYVSDAFHALHTSTMTDTRSRPLRAVVFGLVGFERATAFFKTLKQIERPLTAEALLFSYSRHRKSLLRWVAEGQLDLVQATLLGLLKFLQPRANYQDVRDESRQMGNLARFLADLPGDVRDQAAEFFRDRGYAFPRLMRKRGKQRAKRA